MGRFDDVNEDPVESVTVESHAGDNRFRLVSTLISTPDAISDGDREFRRLEKLVRSDFLKLTADVGIPGESAIYSNLLMLLDDLRELVEFPYLANKNILAVGGEFSAGKSNFLNAIFGVGGLLPTGINPTTSIPTYLTYADQERILAFNTFNRTQILSREELNAISHGFNENQSDPDSRISFYHILRLLQVQSPEMKWRNIAFLDTPGYSKPKESTEDEEMVVGTDAGNTDEEKAREHLSMADFLIWVVAAKDGTFQLPGIQFLRDRVKWNKPLYLLVNKADQVAASDLQGIFERICEDAVNAGFNLAGSSAYSSRERKVYLGDDPRKWFDVIEGKRKFTKWRGRFKRITDGVIQHCNDVETRCAEYEKLLKRLELEPDIDRILSSQVKELRQRIVAERQKRKLAIDQFNVFSEKIERRLETLLSTIGVSDETASDVGLVAISNGDSTLLQMKRGDRLMGTVERFSKFNGCYLRVAGATDLIQIKRAEIEKVTNAAQTFSVGRQFELTVYEVNSGRRQVVLTVSLQ